MGGQAARRIGVFFDSMMRREWAFFRGIEAYAKTKNWRLIAGEEILYLPRSALERWPGDGLLGFLRDPSLIAVLRRAGIPAVNTAQAGAGLGIPSVFPDVHAGGRMAAQYYLERGFRNFAYCVEADLAYRDDKLKGFSERLAEADLSCTIISQPLKLPQKRSWEQHRAMLIRQLRQLPKQTAVWARTDQFAARVVGACETGNIRVPEEIAVMGWGDVKAVCLYTSPPLSSINVDFEDIGFQAAALLDRVMAKDKSAPETVLVPPKAVIERGSTDVMARLGPDLSKALHYIEQHVCDPVWVDDVARHVGMNRRRLERLFRRHLHRSPNTEIVRVRVGRARGLLTETDHSLSEVTALCGFAEYDRLSESFKQATGLTPRAYRKNSK